MTRAIRRTVANGDVDLATRDWAGQGPDLVLLHGLGPDQRSLERLALALTPTHRVITFDQRGFGESSRGPWTFHTALADLDAIIASHNLDSPLVVGHSLGGTIALHHGLTHPRCRGVVNIDGWGPGRPEQYLGKDRDSVIAFQAVALGLRGSTPIASALLAFARAMPKARRSRLTRSEATTAIAHLDVLGLARSVPCRALHFNCIAPVTGAMRLLVGARGVDLLSAYRQGLAADLAKLPQQNANSTIIELSATHDVINSHPDVVARHIVTWADRS